MIFFPEDFQALLNEGMPYNVVMEEPILEDGLQAQGLNGAGGHPLSH